MSALVKTELAESDESLAQPLWHVLVLSVLTSFAYSFWWFYKTFALLSSYQAKYPEKEELACFKDISPLLRTICLFVPLLNFYIAYKLFENIASIYPQKESFVRTHPRVTSALVLACLIAFVCLAKLPGPAYLLCLSAALPLAFVQSWLNKYFFQEEAGQELFVRYAFSTGELIALICGSLLLGLNVAAFMMKIQ